MIFYKIYNFLKALLSSHNDVDKLEQNEKLASIEIFYENGSDKPKLNVLLNDFDPDSMDGLCRLLSMCANEYFFLNVVDIIKQQLTLHNREEELIHILTYVATLDLKQQVINFAKISHSSPVIKPSDISIS